jgi:hypothetical protein
MVKRPRAAPPTGPSSSRAGVDTFRLFRWRRSEAGEPRKTPAGSAGGEPVASGDPAVARTVGGDASVSAGAVAARIDRAPRSLPATRREVNAVVKRKYGRLLPQITAT